MIRVTPSAIEFIAERGGHLTLFAEILSGWCGSRKVPAVRMGKPLFNGLERFEKIAADGVTVWKSDAVQPMKSGEPISIDTGRLLFWKKRIILKNAR